MSAQPSYTASLDVVSGKKTSDLPPCLGYHNLDLVHDAPKNLATTSVDEMTAGGRPQGYTRNAIDHVQSFRLLVVDENREIRETCCEAAVDFGFVGIEAETVCVAREILERKDTSVVMLDLTRSGSDGQSLLAEMKFLCPDTLVIGMSATATIASAVETMRIGASDYLSKPFPPHILNRALEGVTKRLCFDVELRKLQRSQHSMEMGQVLGKSVGMEKLYRMLSKVADSTHPVMIVGESGTGKALVARSIHSSGPNSSKPFVPVDCSSMSPNSLERTLFGDSKGSSTPTDRPRRGLLATQGGGTIFLDDIGDIPLDLQGRLAEVLKEKRIWPINGTQPHILSVRILAATSRDLAKMLKFGYFRMDLYKLLSLVNLRIPPLRGRPDDIAFLAERFLEKVGQRTGISLTLSQETLRVLETYDWPDNTRELETAITHACTLCFGPRLEIDHLPRNILSFIRTRDSERNHENNFTAKPQNSPLEEKVVSMATMEKRAILRALQKANGNKVMAAGLLGIGKTTLYRKLKAYGVSV